MAKIILVTGGARSGKSSYALKRAEKLSPRRLFLATCPRIESADDSEMSERVFRHQQEREGRGWSTIEQETDLSIVLSDLKEKYEVVLLDCITLWVNNILFKEENSGDGKEVTDSTITVECNRWLAAARQFPGTLIIVTNEVGLGIVPDNALARKYRDLVGTCNQLIGKTADEVILVAVEYQSPSKQIYSLGKFIKERVKERP